MQSAGRSALARGHMDVLMPQLGETVAEGKITQWYKAPGDAVRPGDALFEIETDKTSMEVPATSTGVLAEIRAAVGEVVPVGTIVAVISDGTSAPSAAPQARAPAAQPPLSAQAVAQGGAAAVPNGAEAGPPGVRPAGADAVPALKLDPFFEVRTPARNFGPARH